MFSLQQWDFLQELEWYLVAAIASGNNRWSIYLECPKSDGKKMVLIWNTYMKKTQKSFKETYELIKVQFVLLSLRKKASAVGIDGKNDFLESKQGFCRKETMLISLTYKEWSNKLLNKQ